MFFFQLAESLHEVFSSFKNFSRWDVREMEALASGHPLSNRRPKVGGLVRITHTWPQKVTIWENVCEGKRI